MTTDPDPDADRTTDLEVDSDMDSDARIDVDIEVPDWTSALPDAEAVARRAAVAALTGAEGGLVVLLTDDAAVRDLNARFRDRDRPTNVLSFPAAEMPMPGQARHLGDIVLAYGVCAEEAAAQGKSLADHLTHLVVHGTLHVLGRDHADDAEADAMEAEEAVILTGLGVSDPYRIIDDH